jgi:predicted DNA-binding transcriptional regulator AlpA
MPDAKLPPLLSADEVARLFKVSPRTLKRTVELGTFPSPVALPGTGGNGSRRIAWRGVDIQECLDSLKPVRIESQDGASNV